MKFQGKDYECGSVKVGERGQIVIPKNVRDEIGINHGDDLIILGNKEDGIKIIVANSLEELAEIVLKSKKKGK
ncbi:MAG: AbrB/MazE/SpoVT family DNA-binding domain-containing protein [Leptotrichiaceae bacterium]|jgi:AbrB family looped-hinge helix DNA binding protein|nr:AbrB/MazE/SpoVT family DNA-binding domain-containing protein [Leptotrichiaceae bacterium]MBP6281546.1 AbrB/MazE/SpoVT family DNA-binding domain-containing protein [Leptotrichiaceae bacterium]MBP7100895.1 AbrB/MazE/SpoVT family DNA-binding domain-containing protein [Leptotrichiaceae bacterium]MBP7725527.1 AbrB/MazE/SpoVT family DNA-binding domain-containing protein [Leptotrichiaceae bacterium]MBP9630172.1 AbrB/MazE/SpoVT family DNA-binding domain-containing protein [Leptotrichiaceae bacterium